jgi:hypothetical protein
MSCDLPKLFMTLSFLSLSVIPAWGSLLWTRIEGIKARVCSRTSIAASAVFLVLFELKLIARALLTGAAIC